MENEQQHHEYVFQFTFDFVFDFNDDIPGYSK